LGNLQKAIAIDFDGCIHDREHPIEGRRMGAPMHEAKESLFLLKLKGFKIVVFCVWADCPANIETIAKWMDFYDCQYSEITNIKPDAVAYIDNKAIKFTDWRQVIETLDKEL
jgi:hypothetical protein